MLKIIHHFFAFCQPDNRRRFLQSIWLTFLESLFNALKVVSIYIFINGALSEKDMGKVSYPPLVCSIMEKYRTT